MKIFNSLLVFIGMFVFSVSAQEDAVEISELTVGDVCPDFEFRNMLNSENPYAKLSDFKGKLVILDFWATWCKGCITTMAKLDSLQKIFANDLIILPVTYQTREEVEKFMKANKIINKLDLPTVTDDTKLSKYFPYRILPHEVWIDKDGTVLAITSEDDVTGEKIAKVIETGNAMFKPKGRTIDVVYEKPLLLGGIENLDIINAGNLIYSSLLTGYIEGLPGSGSYSASKIGDHVKINNFNNEIRQLYQMGFKAGTPNEKPWDINFYLNMPARCILELRDSTMFQLPWDEESKLKFKNKPKEEKYFTYERVIPKADSLSFNTYIINDLNSYFGHLYRINGNLEKRKVKCLALRRNTARDILKSKGGEPKLETDDSGNKSYLKITNLPLKRFMHQIVTYGLGLSYPIPIIDDTNYNFPIDIELNCDLTKVETLNEKLIEYGLQLEVIVKEIDMIVFKDI